MWFVYEGDRLYLLPVKGSDSHAVSFVPAAATVMDDVCVMFLYQSEPKRITDAGKVKEVADKFRAKYGAADVKKYYSKLDVSVEIDVNR